MRAILLLGLAILATTSCNADIGETLEQSLERYGEPVRTERNRVLWDTGSVTFEATFDTEGKFDTRSTYIDEHPKKGQPTFTEHELQDHLWHNMLVAFHEVPNTTGRAWQSVTPGGPKAFFAPRVSPLSGKPADCIQIGTLAGYKHLEEIRAQELAKERRKTGRPQIK